MRATDGITRKAHPLRRSWPWLLLLIPLVGFFAWRLHVMLRLTDTLLFRARTEAVLGPRLDQMAWQIEERLEKKGCIVRAVRHGEGRTAAIRIIPVGCGQSLDIAEEV